MWEGVLVLGSLEVGVIAGSVESLVLASCACLLLLPHVYLMVAAFALNHKCPAKREPDPVPPTHYACQPGLRAHAACSCCGTVGDHAPAAIYAYRRSLDHALWMWRPLQEECAARSRGSACADEVDFHHVLTFFLPAGLRCR